MIEVIEAKYIDEYRIWVRFNNLSDGIVDLKNILWGKIFEPLKDIKNFQKFSISEDFKTLVWENGADIAPEYLLDNLT